VAGRHEATADLGGFSPTVVIVALDERFPGIDPARLTLVVDRSQLAAVTDERTTQPTFLLLEGQPEDAAQMAATLRDEDLAARLVSRYERLDDIAGDPFSRWTDRALRTSAAFSLLFAVVGSVSATAITEPGRRRDLSLLEILGLRTGEARTITAIEHVPATLLSVLFGALAGISAARLLESPLGLGAFAGGNTTAGISVDVTDIAAVVGVVFIAVTVVVAASVRVMRRTRGATMLRRGDN